MAVSQRDDWTEGIVRKSSFGLVIASVLLSTATSSAKKKLAVMPLKNKRVPAEVVEVLDELLLTQAASAVGHKFEIVGASDINAMLGLDRMKNALGCDDVSCAAEIGGALGVDGLIAGSVSRLGSEITITLKLINIDRQRVDSRAASTVQQNEDLYRRALTEAVASLFRLPAPSVGFRTESAREDGEVNQEPDDHRDAASRHFVSPQVFWRRLSWGGTAMSMEAGILLAYRWQHTPLLSMRLKAGGGPSSSAAAVVVSVGEEYRIPLLRRDSSDDPWDIPLSLTTAVNFETSIFTPFQVRRLLAQFGIRAWWLTVEVVIGTPISASASYNGKEIDPLMYGFNLGVEFGL